MSANLVCSICGSSRITSVQPSVDPRYPLGLCRDCRREPLPPSKDAPKEQWDRYVASMSKPRKTPLTPLVPAGEFAKRERPTKAEPEDLFADFAPSAFNARPTNL